MTKQEIFDTVVKHLRQQGRPAGVFDDDGEFKCRYLAPNGDTCSVGCLILPEEYDPEMEGKGIAFEIFRPVMTRIGMENTQLLYALQRIHDGFAVPRWEEQFQRVAKQNGLAVP